MIDQVGPILRSMRHHKGAFSLLVLEVALGFVMLTHTLIAARYYHRLHVHDTGMPENELVVVRRRFLHPRDIPAARATERADLGALSQIEAASAAVNVVPLPDAAAFPATIRTAGGPESLAWPVRATTAVDRALGLQLVAGHGLDNVTRDAEDAIQILITRDIARRLFGDERAAVGRIIEGSTFGHGRVTGVVRDFTYRGGWLPDAPAMILVADEPATEHDLTYVVRGTATAPRAAVIAAAQQALATLPADPDAVVTVLPLDRSATRFSKLSEGAVIILTWTGFLVVAVALAGSLALSSFSVAERTRQIGVRRALGARRGEIVRYFLLENHILTFLGLLLGVGLAVALNLVLRRIMADLVLTPDAVLISMAVFLVTGLLSALVPARRAAAIPPWAATRTL